MAGRQRKIRHGAGVAYSLLLAGAAGIGYTADTISLGGFGAVVPGSGCTIKGNVSFSGERIYHVPGQDYYDETRIRPEFGER